MFSEIRTTDLILNQMGILTGTNEILGARDLARETNHTMCYQGAIRLLHRSSEYGLQKWWLDSAQIGAVRGKQSRLTSNIVNAIIIGFLPLLSSSFTTCLTFFAMDILSQILRQLNIPT